MRYCQRNNAIMIHHWTGKNCYVTIQSSKIKKRIRSQKEDVILKVTKTGPMMTDWHSVFVKVHPDEDYEIAFALMARYLRNMLNQK